MKKADRPTLLVFAFHEILPDPHSPYFVPDHEPSLKTGIEVEIAAILELLGKPQTVGLESSCRAEGKVPSGQPARCRRYLRSSQI